MVYHVVRFVKTDEVELVPQVWLAGKEHVFWPDKKNPRKLIETQALPDPMTWASYQVKVLCSGSKCFILTSYFFSLSHLQPYI